MDHWFNIIVKAMSREQGTPEERRIALVRAGTIASAYNGDIEAVEEVFGDSTADNVLENHRNHIDSVLASRA